MKIKLFFLMIMVLFISLSGCTTAGSKFININYLGKVKASNNLTVGISDFKDNRNGVEKGYIGKRILNSGNEEIYLVKGLNVAQTITKTFKTYFENSGYDCITIDDWQHTPEGVVKADKKYKYILSGKIEEFDFFANKGFVTSMTLDIKLIVYLGNPVTGKLTTIPVTLNLKQKDLKFTKQTVETFINESVTEVIMKSMVL
jgi:hypothetical protein